MAEAWTAPPAPPFLWLRVYRGGGPVGNWKKVKVGQKLDITWYFKKQYVLLCLILNQYLRSGCAEAWYGYRQDVWGLASSPVLARRELDRCNALLFIYGHNYAHTAKHSFTYHLQMRCDKNYSRRRYKSRIICIESSRLTNLDLWADLNSFFEAPEGTKSSNSLSANGLQLSQFPATTAPILQNTLCILPQLRDKHQGPGENLQQTPK